MVGNFFRLSSMRITFGDCSAANEVVDNNNLVAFHYCPSVRFLSTLIFSLGESGWDRNRRFSPFLILFLCYATSSGTANYCVAFGRDIVILVVSSAFVLYRTYLRPGDLLILEGLDFGSDADRRLRPKDVRLFPISFGRKKVIHRFFEFEWLYILISCYRRF